MMNPHKKFNPQKALENITNPDYSMDIAGIHQLPCSLSHSAVLGGMEHKLPETPEQVDEFIRAVESGEIPTPPAPNRNLLIRLCTMKDELDRLKSFCREEVLHEIYNQHGQNTSIIENLRRMVATENEKSAAAR